MTQQNHGCQGGCQGCESGGGGCGACCGKGDILLCIAEKTLLEQLGQYAFLPIIQERGGERTEFHPIPQDAEWMPQPLTEIIFALKNKGLITVDPKIPLSNVEYGPMGEQAEVRCGSLGLTQRGQEALHWLPNE